MNIGNMLGSMLGLVPTIASGAYALRKNRGEADALRDIQRHGGAGAAAARAVTDATARNMMGTAAGQGGQAGGLNLLAGLRAGEQTRQAGQAQAAQVAATEAAAATRQLDRNEIARRQGIMKLASGLGNIFPTVASQVLASKDQGAPAEVMAPPPIDTGQTEFSPADLAEWDQFYGGPSFEEQDAQQTLEQAPATLAPAQPAAQEQPAPEAQPASAAPQKLGDLYGDSPNYDAVKEQAYNITLTPGYQSLRVAGLSHLEALDAIAPEVAQASRAALGVA